MDVDLDGVLAGLIQIGFGLLKAGVLGYFFPFAVVHGMLAGIGLIIAIKQIPHALGYDANPEGDLSFVEREGGTALSALNEMLAFVHPGAALISVGSLAILISWEQSVISRHRWLGMIPGPVVAVLFATCCQLLLSSSQVLQLSASHLVSVPVASNFGEFTRMFAFPDFTGQIGNPAVWGTALTIAVVASIETLLSVEAIDKMDPRKRTTPTNRELVAQGVGNTVSGLVGGLPITQVIVRSTVNLQAGARSRKSTVSHGLLLFGCIVLLPTQLNQIPLAGLAAVLLITGYKLAKPALFLSIWRSGYEQFLPFVVTVLGVVFVDLLVGVGLGMAVAVLILLQRSYSNSHFLHMHEDRVDGGERVLTMLLAEEVTFLNKAAIKKELDQVPDDTTVVIDQSKCVYMNHDVMELIADFVKVAPTRGIQVQVIDRDRAPRVAKSLMEVA